MKTTKRRSRRPATSKITEGTRLSYNVSQRVKYDRALRALIEKMTYEVKKTVIKFFEAPVAKQFYKKQEELTLKATMDASIASQARILMDTLLSKFAQLFGRAAEPVAQKMVDGATAASSASLHTSLKKLSGGLTLKTNLNSANLKEITKASVTENVALIKSISNEYLTNVQKQVMRSITTGSGLEDLVPALEKYEGITYRKAKNIALDQTRKVYNATNAERMKTVGVGKFKWVHSGGGQKPREQHVGWDGKIFSFDDLPIDEGLGVPVIPGQAPFCGCTMVPVIEYNEEESE